MRADFNDIGKLYYKSNEDGELHELGLAVNLCIQSEVDCISTGTVDFRFTNDTFKKHVIMSKKHQFSQ